jgi:hypothetical protein
MRNPIPEEIRGGTDENPGWLFAVNWFLESRFMELREETSCHIILTKPARHSARVAVTAPPQAACHRIPGEISPTDFC